MSSFKLEDCPKLGPYRLAKTREGRLAVFRIDYTGGERWELNGDGQENHNDLVGPWEGKAIVGWTAEEMAEVFSTYLWQHFGYDSWENTKGKAHRIKAMQSMIDNEPREPVWCKHIFMKEQNGWFFGDMICANRWKVCPICEAKRPLPSK